MHVYELLTLLDRHWPAVRAESWDRPGIQIADADEPVKGIGFALDWSRDAADVLVPTCNVILTHHPLFFEPVHALDRREPREALICDTVRRHMTVWSCHTNLDNAHDETAVSRALAAALGLETPRGYRLQPGDPVNNPEGGYGWVEPYPELDGRGLLTAIEALPGYTGILSPVLGDRKLTELEDTGPLAFWGGSWDHGQLHRLTEHGVRTLVAGEIRYHDMEDLLRRGIRPVAIGHDVSETPVLRPWARRVRAILDEHGFKVPPLRLAAFGRPLALDEDDMYN